MKNFLNEIQKMEVEIKKINSRLAPIAVSMVQENMKDPSHKLNAPLTKKLKNGGAKPLFNTGATRASITYDLKDEGFVIGTNLKHASIINNGGLIKPKKAKQLALPTTRQVKLRADALGVKKLLNSLKKAGWNIIFRNHKIYGKAPYGAKAFGLKLKTKLNKNVKSKNQGVLYLLFYRTPKVKVPKREFMRLSNSQKKELLDLTYEILTK